jgi:hypothetical protein
LVYSGYSFFSLFSVQSNEKAERNHWSECGRASSLARADASGRPHRSVPVLDEIARMNTLTIKPVPEQPTELVIFPDFIVSAMLRVGPSFVEADATLQQDGSVEFWLKERRAAQPSVIGRVPVNQFRLILARFATFGGLGNLFGDHVLFACDFERDGKIRPHRFSLFLCNEPTVAYWLRLYLYCIDGVFPSFKKP